MFLFVFTLFFFLAILTAFFSFYIIVQCIHRINIACELHLVLRLSVCLGLTTARGLTPEED